MRCVLKLTLTVCFVSTCALSACQSTWQEPYFHPPIEREWQLVEMKGLEAAYNRSLSSRDKPISVSRNVSELRLQTREHWGAPNFELVRFNGCQDVVSIDLTTKEFSPYGKNSNINGDDLCRNLESTVGMAPDQAKRYDSVENFSFYRVAETQFIKLVKDVADHKIEYVVHPDVLDLLDKNGVLLMRFKQHEVLE